MAEFEIDFKTMLHDFLKSARLGMQEEVSNNLMEQLGGRQVIRPPTVDATVGVESEGMRYPRIFGGLNIPLKGSSTLSVGGSYQYNDFSPKSSMRDFGVTFKKSF